MVPKEVVEKAVRVVGANGGPFTTDLVVTMLGIYGYTAARPEISLTLAEIADEDKRLRIEGEAGKRIYRLISA